MLSSYLKNLCWLLITYRIKSKLTRVCRPCPTLDFPSLQPYQAVSCFLCFCFSCVYPSAWSSFSLLSRRLWDDSSPTPGVDFDYSKLVSSRHFPVNCYLSQSDWREGDILFLGERTFSLIIYKQENRWPQLPLAAVLWPQGMMKHAWKMEDQREWMYVHDNIILDILYWGLGLSLPWDFSTWQINSLLLKPFLWSYLHQKSPHSIQSCLFFKTQFKIRPLPVVIHSLP